MHEKGESVHFTHTNWRKRKNTESDYLDERKERERKRSLETHVGKKNSCSEQFVANGFFLLKRERLWKEGREKMGEYSTLPLRPMSHSSRSASEGEVLKQLRRHPSQATMWYTTVPQAMRSQELGGRHAPTRRSLRHSRMLVNSSRPKPSPGNPTLLFWNGYFLGNSVTVRSLQSKQPKKGFKKRTAFSK